MIPGGLNYFAVLKCQDVDEIGLTDEGVRDPAPALFAGVLVPGKDRVSGLDLLDLLVAAGYGDLCPGNEAISGTQYDSAPKSIGLRLDMPREQRPRDMSLLKNSNAFRRRFRAESGGAGGIDQGENRMVWRAAAGPAPASTAPKKPPARTNLEDREFLELFQQAAR